MSYTINLTNGNIYATIPDGTINTNSSMTLIGKNYAGYGQFLDDNFIHLLENSANGTQPPSPLTGQLWFNTTSGVLNVYNGVGFKPLGGANAANAAPTNNTTGDLWYDTTNEQLNVYTGTAWLLVGPVYTPSTGVTGAIPALITDANTVQHSVLELFVGNAIVGMISKDATFTVNAVPGFTNIQPGITLASNIASQIPQFTGTATNSLALGSVPAASFVQNSSSYISTGIFAVGNGNATIGNATNQFGNIYGTATNALSLGGLPANAYVSTGGGGSSGTITVGSVLNGGGNGSGTIGNSTNWFGTIYGTAINSLYADVAERFAADDVYEAGTVVEIGGSAEITKSTTELSNKVFGVISTKPGYTMNGGAGDNATHPPVAMTGRVPVRVTGTVNKGDRLVSAGNGIARVALDSELTPFNVIGRALASKTDAGLGTVEAIVTIRS